MRGLRRRGDVWHVDTTILGEKVQCTTGCRRKADARLFLEQLVQRKRAAASGHLAAADPEQLVADLIADYLQHQRARGNTPQHVREVRSILTKLAISAGVETIGALTRGAIERGLEHWAERSSRTRQKATTITRSWLSWLERTERWDRNPARAVRAPKLVRHRVVRRALTASEVRRLLEAAPVDRSLVYRVAITTGLRRSELRRLGHEDLQLDRAAIVLPTEKAKSAGGLLPLPAATVEAWAAWLADPVIRRGAGWGRSKHVLPRPPVVGTLRSDLEAAGVSPLTDQGRVDFHALRKTFGSLLQLAGAPLTLAQQLMRHSDPRLTANIYTGFEPRIFRDAVESVGCFLAEASNDNAGTGSAVAG